VRVECDLLVHVVYVYHNVVIIIIIIIMLHSYCTCTLTPRVKKMENPLKTGKILKKE